MKVQMKNLHGTEQETAPFPPISSLNNNILICGSSGTGKSTLLQLIEQLKPPKLKMGGKGAVSCSVPCRFFIWTFIKPASVS